ncbi:MAG: VTT domain-containing protein [Dehalococcoidia bacterium]
MRPVDALIDTKSDDYVEQPAEDLPPPRRAFLDRVRHGPWLTAAGIFLFAGMLSLFLFVFRDFFDQLGQWGYPGTLLIMALNNATIVFPTLGHAFLIASAQVLNPWMLGIFGGVGAAIGELTGYALGRSGHGMVANKGPYLRLRRWMRWTGPVLFLFAATPLPFDLAGVLAGTMRYSVWRFLLWTMLGKIVQTTAIAVGSYYAIAFFYRWLGFGITD